MSVIRSALGKDPSPPPAPNYGGAAGQTSESNLAMARAAAAANRINQYTPYGSIEYTSGVNGNPDQWRSDINLSPSGQTLLDQQNAMATRMGTLGVQGLDRVDQSFSKPFDYGSVKDVQDSAYSTHTARLDPQWQMQEKQLQSRLANQGIPVGSEAWQNEMRAFSQAKNDAYTQARMSAIQTAPQTMQLATSLREQPLNEVNALRTGAQITNPQFQPAGQQQTTSGANYLGAAGLAGQYDMNSYNQKVAMANQDMAGLFSLGQQAMAGPQKQF